jgi:putative nucleotidyltransferase with HDIG domain
MGKIIMPYDSPEMQKSLALRIIARIICRVKAIDLAVLNAILRHSDRRMRKDYLNVIRTLADIIEANDPYTRGHCEKVMNYSLRICKKLDLAGHHVSAIKTASQLHDIGKISIDLTILRKKEELTKDDWQKIRTHPDVGAKIVHQVGFLDDIVPIIKHHHERYSGGGYPDGSLKNSKIPLGARIIAVADAYDAMTSARPYRKALSREAAICELKKCAGTQFDPEIVSAFITV